MVVPPWLFFSLAFAVSSVASLAVAAAPAPELVKNIHTGVGEIPQLSWAVPLSPTQTVFTLNDTIHGEELWITDGTEAGTHLLKEIGPGPDQGYIANLVASAGKVFFSASDLIHGGELWVTDGTEAGTRVVKEMKAGFDGGNPVCLKPVKGGIVFVSDSEAQGTSLWFSDGSATGTVPLKELLPGEFFSSSVYADASWKTGDTLLYFISPSSTEGSEELWKTDGTAGGTTRVKTLTNGDGQGIFMIGTVGNILYFSRYEEGKGRELWKSNGTSAGTVMVKDIATGPDDSSPYEFVAIDNKGYFLASTPEDGTAIWMTDGTGGGTVQLKKIPVLLDATSGYFGYFEKLAVAGKKLFAQINGTPTLSGRGIWVYNPKTSGSEMVFELQGEEDQPGVTQLVSTASRAYFSPSYAEKSSLFVSDGMAAGTQVVHENLAPGAGRIFGDVMIPVGERLLFITLLPDRTQAELWMTEGSPQGTRRLRGDLGMDGNANPGGPYSAGTLAIIDGVLYFPATDGAGYGIWRSDGTAQGTWRVKAFPETPYASPTDLVAYNSQVYFALSGGLWRTDGTEAGTELVSNTPASPQNLFVFDGRLFFSGVVAGAGDELCVSDGTPEGTRLLADLNVNPRGLLNSWPSSFLEMDGSVYFIAEKSGKQLFRLAAGPSSMPEMLTQLFSVRDLVVRPASADHPQATLFFLSGNTLYSCVNGGQPVAVRAFLASPYSVTLNALKLCGDEVVFEREWRGHVTLWLSDGTEAGTRPLVEIENFSCNLSGVAGDTVYFSQGNERGLRDLKCIQMDGTGLTHLITDIGAYGAVYSKAIGNTIFLGSQTQSGINSLWRSQGTPETTVRLAAISPGEMTLLGNRLYFSNLAPGVGRELFSLDVSGHLQLRVAGQAGTLDNVLPGSGAVLDLGPQVVGQARTRVLKLRNRGDLPLENITLELASGEEFGLAGLALGTLAGGEEKQVEVTFTPDLGGGRSDELSIRAGAELLQTVALTGKGLAPGDAPVLVQVSSSRLVLGGQPLVLDAEVVSADAISSYVWKKNGVPVGDQRVLSLPVATAADVGHYTFEATNAAHLSVSSGAVSIGVVLAPPAAVALKIGDLLKLNCHVTAPSGSQIRYEWLQDGLPVPLHERVRGAFDKELVIQRLQESDVGVFTCRVTMAASGTEATLETPGKIVSILVTPELQLEGSDLQHFVGQQVSVQLTASQPTTKFTAKGLPPGLTLNAAGQITGRPTKALPVDPKTGQRRAYAVTVTASNTAGNGPPLSFSWMIHPMLPAGSYDGLLDRNAALDGDRNLGSRVKLTVASTGVVSGQLILAGKTYRFSSPLVVDADVIMNSAVAEVSISRGKGISPLKLTLQIENDAWYLALADDQQNIAEGRAFIRETDKVLLDSYDGFYTWNSGPEPSSNREIPQGAGFMTGNLTKAGVMTWAGKLADGTAVTGSGGVTDLDETSQVGLAVHSDLYGLTGSLHGWTRLSNQGQSGNPVAVSGTLTWSKAPLPTTSKVRVYKTGIPLHDLSLSGGLYKVPTREGAIGQSTPQGEPNAAASLFSYILPELYTGQDFTLNKANKATLPKTGEGAFLKTLSFDPVRGTFKGTVVLWHSTPALTRTATFEGVLSYTEKCGNGFFLLPQLPEEGRPASDLKITPLISNHLSVTAW